MNNLNEAYETLLRRGMPEHWLLMGDIHPQEVGVHAERIADIRRDVLTMHALRWFIDAVDDEPVIERWNGPTRPTGNTAPGFDIQYMRKGDDSTGYDGFGPTLLDAILEATKHLEPAQTNG